MKRFGPLSAMVTGLLIFASAMFEVFVPLSENSTVTHALHPTYFFWYHLTMFCAGIAGLSAVPVLTRLVSQDDFINWTRHLAWLGFALLAADNFRQLRVDHHIAHAFMDAEPAVQQAILISWQGLVELNPQALLSVLLVVIWMIAISLRLRGERKGGRNLLLIVGCLLVGIALLAAGILMDLRSVRVAAVSVAAASLPLWFMLLGRHALRGQAAASE